MTGFPLKIVTPDGLEFDGIAESLTVRTVTGDMGIMAKHVDCVVPLGMGEATVVIDGQRRRAACIGGMVSVINGSVNLVPTTFEWADEIDVERAKASKERAEKMLADPGCDEQTKQYANARLKRAQVRLGIAGKK